MNIKNIALSVSYGALAFLALKAYDNSYYDHDINVKTFYSIGVSNNNFHLNIKNDSNIMLDGESQFPVAIVQNTNSDIMCLAQNIYFEARGESYEGQVMVALTTMNRVKSANQRWSNSICDVVYQENDAGISQFSWVMDKTFMDLSNVEDRQSFDQALQIATKVVNGEVKDISGGANHYYNPNKASPKWASNMVLIGDYGNHKFLKD
jgi:spore germination cell wall hydrolase CwlJ-like protein